MRLPIIGPSGFLAALCVTFCVIAGSVSCEGAQLKAGFAERDITPPLGSEQPGGYGKAYQNTVHDPCKVRAAVFDDGTNRVALVGIDTLAVRGPFVQGIREEITQKTGIPAEAILIGASHSHSSGPLSMILPGEFDHADEFVRDLAYNKSSCANADYMNTCHAAVVEAVCDANQKREDVQAGVGSGQEDKVAFNRRFRMKSGLSYTHPGQGNPDIIEYAGPIDPEVGVIGTWNGDGKLTGCIVNYACHATTSPPGFSANWIYYMEKVIRGYFGEDVVVVFLQGASGDITQVDNLSPYQHPDGDTWAQRVGGCVGAEAVKQLLLMPRGALVPVAAVCETMEMGRRVPKPERVAACLEMAKKTPGEVGATEWTFAKEIVLLDAKLKKEPTVHVEVQAVQIGPAVFVTNPAEYFVELGLRIKKESPFEFTFAVELANGCVGYVPTEEALGPGGGGYETRLSNYSNLEVKAGTKIADKGIELAKRLTPGEAPKRPAHPPFSGSGWGYGNVPPEVD